MSSLPLLISTLILSSFYPSYYPSFVDAFDCTFKSTYPLAYLVPYTSTPPPLTGNPDSPIWKNVKSSSPFVDITGNTSLPPRYTTTFKMLYDSTYLYILGHLQEPQIWANQTKDNTVIFQDNDFEVFVDPAGSNAMYKEIEVNALSKVWDLCLNHPYSDTGYENSTRVTIPSYDMLPTTSTSPNWSPLKSAVTALPEGSINDPSKTPSEGWGVEMALPLVGLTYNTTALTPKPKDSWRINFSRVEWRVKVVDGEYVKDPDYPNEDNWVWNPIGVVDMHEPDKWGIIQFGDLDGGQGEVEILGSWGVRETLMNVYYAQKSYYGVNYEYTEDVGVLDAFAPVKGSCLECGVVDVEVEGEDWTAVTTVGGWKGKVNQVRYLEVEKVEG